MNNQFRGVISAAALAGMAGMASAQVLVDLGKLPGGAWNYASTLSDDGSVVCGSADVSGGKARAYRWTAAGGLVNLGVAGGADHSYGYGMSGSGSVVVGASGAAYDTACRWTQATGMVSLGSLATGKPSFAFDATQDGSVVVGDGYLSNSLQKAFRWTQATGMQPFGQILAGCDQSLALGITPTGSFLFGYCYHNAPQLVMPTACRWDAAGNIISLGVLAGSAESVPSDCSADGSVIVGYCADMQGQNTRSFRWSASTSMEELPPPAGITRSIAGSITGDGAVITGYGFVGQDVEAVLWINGASQRVSDYLSARGVSTSGWTLRTAIISAGGSAMAGWGIHNGVGTSWYINLGCTDAPAITTQPQSQTISLGSPVTFSVVATGPSLQYQWYKNNATIGGANASSYTINSVVQNDAGDYYCMVSNSCGGLASNIATLTVDLGCIAPAITGQPSSQTISLGSPVTFSVVATGTDLGYQWFQNGSIIDGAIAANYTIQAVAQGDEGDYSCLVSNACGDDLSAPATLTISYGCEPTVTDQPDTVRTCPGTMATLSLSAVGDGELSYQWRKDGEDIFGAIESSYVIWSASVLDTGSYDCVVENDCGHVTSDAALVVVCLADFNCDGFVNGNDYDEFAELFDYADPAADLNADGFVNGDDYDLFASAFDLGC
ncbi:MAG: immunoglobulin domain-containing protein [Phycisphaerales bacterium]|jgi:probable HAF family extracellular repeat protein|nr:immunoglobulin domain-containing protein [Phycisphaerales bacterium]